MNENELAKIVFEAGLKVHRGLGTGLLESAYEECVYDELYCLNLKVEKQKPLPLIYHEVILCVPCENRCAPCGKKRLNRNVRKGGAKCASSMYYFSWKFIEIVWS